MSQRLIGYIVKNQFGSFVPMIGVPVVSGKTTDPTLLTVARVDSAFVQLEFARQTLTRLAPQETPLFLEPVDQPLVGFVRISHLVAAAHNHAAR